MVDVPSGECGAERAAGVARGRLHPDIAENLLSQELAVGDAVERDAARKTEIFDIQFAPGGTREPAYDFFGHLLDRRRKVHLTLGQRGFRLTRRAAEKIMKFRPSHGQTGCIVKIVYVEPESAVGLQVQQMVEYLAGVPGRTIRREAH